MQLLFEYKENHDEQKVIAIIILFPVTGKKYSSIKCGIILKKGGSYDTSQAHPKYAHGYYYIMYVWVCEESSPPSLINAIFGYIQK